MGCFTDPLAVNIYIGHGITQTVRASYEFRWLYARAAYGLVQMVRVAMQGSTGLCEASESQDGDHMTQQTCRPVRVELTLSSYVTFACKFGGPNSGC